MRAGAERNPSGNRQVQPEDRSGEESGKDIIRYLGCSQESYLWRGMG